MKQMKRKAEFKKDKGWRVGEKKDQLRVLQACCEINEEGREIVLKLRRRLTVGKLCSNTILRP